ADHFCRKAAVAQRAGWRAALGRRRDGAEAEDGAGAADDAVEPVLRDLLQVGDDLVVDVTDEPPLVARLQRIALDEPLREADHAQLEALSQVDRGAGAERDFDAAAA